MSFVINVLLLMFGAFVVMMFQTRMRQQELAEQLSRLQKEVERLSRRQPSQEQRLPESESGELLRSKNEYREARQPAGRLPANASGKAQPDFNSWPYNPDAPTSAASAAPQPHSAAFERIPADGETPPAQTVYLSAHSRSTDAVVQPLEQTAPPEFSLDRSSPRSLSGSLTPDAAADSKQAIQAAPPPEPAAAQAGIRPGSRPGTVKIRKRAPAGAQPSSPTSSLSPAHAAARHPAPAASPLNVPAQARAAAPQERRPIRAAEPEQESAFAPLIDWLMRGNLLLKTGVVVLFLGLVFLLRFASERIHVPIEARYAAVALSGLAAAVAGWFLQRRRREYGLILQGFGMAVMYLTTLAAVKLHPLLPAGTAFALMVCLVCGMALLALRQDAEIMAQVALIGGLAAPVLVSDGSGSHVVLFTYLALLNTGVAAIARFKSWRSLNLIGFTGTFGIALMWGMGEYTVERLKSAEPFLLYHWLLYTMVACLYALHRRDESDEEAVPDNAGLDELADSLLSHGSVIGAIDGTLLFGTAAAAFALQYNMLPEGANQWAAGAALGFAGVYALLAAYFSGSRDFPLLRQSLGALSLLFVTLAVPLAFGHEATISLWSLEAALVYIFALRQRRPHTRLLASLVYLLSLGALLINGGFGLPEYGGADAPVLAGSVVSTFSAALAGLAMYAAWLYWRARGSARWEADWQRGALGAGLLLAGLLPLLCCPQHWAVVALAALAWAAVRAQAALQERWEGMPAVLPRRSSRRSLSGSPKGEAEDGGDDAWLPGGSLLVAAAAGYGAVVLPLLSGLFWNDLIQVAGIYPPSGWLAGRGWLLTACCGATTLLVGATAYALHTRSEDNAAEAAPRGRALRQGVGWALLALALFGTVLFSFNLLQRLPDAWAEAAPLWCLPLPFALWSAAVWRLDWRQGKRAALLLVPLLAPNALWLGAWLNRVGFARFAFSGSLMLVALALLLLWVLRVQRFRSRGVLRSWGVAAFVLWTAQATAFAGMLAGETLGGVWVQLAWLALPLALWLLLYRGRGREELRPYAAACSLLCGDYALLWLLLGNALEPRSVAPLGYWPLLNPIDLAGLAVGALWLASAEMWREEFELEGEGLHLHLAGCVLAGLTLVSGAVLRLWYFYMGVEWTLPGIMASFGLQAALSIVWAATAIGLMVSGHRSGRRIRWMAGAGLMGLVVLKLFTVELGGSGGIARIVSFIGVGLLLVLVGWFAPVPPRED